jgi:hypothetical protein
MDPNIDQADSDDDGIGDVCSTGIVNLGGSVVDTKTNLEWLALNVPAHCSLDNINNRTNGCTFLDEGWRLATAEQVTTFLEDAGVPVGQTTPPDQNAIDLILALGPTNVVADANPDFLVKEIWGITSTPGPIGTGFVAPFVSLFESVSGANANFTLAETATEDIVPHIPSRRGDAVVSYWFVR